MMRFDIMTLFPGLVDTVLSESIIGRARKSGAIEVNTYNIRDYSEDKNRRVDDTPYGGGKGMLMLRLRYIIAIARSSIPRQMPRRSERT